MDSSLVHTQCFTNPLSVDSERSAWVGLSSCPLGSGLPIRRLGCVQGWTDSAHRSLLCLSSHWWASSWTFTLWWGWPLGPGPYLASGWWLVSDFPGQRGFLRDWTQSSSYCLCPELSDTRTGGLLGIFKVGWALSFPSHHLISLLGFVIYFGYGIRHSLKENNELQPPASTSQTWEKHPWCWVILTTGNRCCWNLPVHKRVCRFKGLCEPQWNVRVKCI